MSPITETLQAVASLIESTYDHDEDGNRTNMDCPMSGADVTEALMGMEGAIFDTLAESKAMPDLLGALQDLVDDLTDADEDHNQETGEVYGSVANARDVLAKTRGENTCEACAGISAGPIPGTLANGERCDACELYESDEAAQAAVAKATETAKVAR